MVDTGQTCVLGARYLPNAQPVTSQPKCGKDWSRCRTDRRMQEMLVKLTDGVSESVL